MDAVSLDYGDRKEIWYMLDKLGTAQRRIAFVRWCCSKCRVPMEIKVTTHTGTANEAYQDLLNMEHQFGLDLNMALRELNRRI